MADPSDFSQQDIHPPSGQAGGGEASGRGPSGQSAGNAASREGVTQEELDRLLNESRGAGSGAPEDSGRADASEAQMAMQEPFAGREGDAASTIRAASSAAEMELPADLRVEDDASLSTSSPAPRPPDLPAFDENPSARAVRESLAMLKDVDLKVRIELGRTRMLVEDVLQLGEGSVVELDRLAGDPVDVYVNERLIARGEILVLNDNFCVRVGEVFTLDPHRLSSDF